MTHGERKVDKGSLRGLNSVVPKSQGLGTRLGTWVYIEITSSSSIPSSGRTPYVQETESNLVRQSGTVYVGL